MLLKQTCLFFRHGATYCSKGLGGDWNVVLPFAYEFGFKYKQWNVGVRTIRTEDVVLGSNSSTFYKQLLRWYFCTKKLKSQTVTWEKLRKTLLYEKVWSKMLMKLTPWVNYTNILQAAFLYESFIQSFSWLTVLVCIF